MKIRHAMLLATVFFIQFALAVGYFVVTDFKSAIGVASVIIPFIGYLMVGFNLTIFQQFPAVLRVLVSLAFSASIWVFGGYVITVPLVLFGITKPR